MTGLLRVLYVDDEPGLLGIGKLFLEREGAFTVDTLTSAREALGQLNSERYDAIISDYQMPDMDGITFLKQLKASGNTTPFIIFTGRGREEVVIEALNEGADFYIQKGGEPKAQFVELANKIRYAVSRRRSEEKLGASAEEIKEASSRYEALIAASNTGAWEYHADSGFLWCSPEYFSMLGRDIRDFDISGTRNIEQTWIDLLHPEDRESARRQFDTYLGNPEGMYEQYFRVLHKDGHWVWVWSRGKTIQDANGNPTSITVGTHIDITGRKLAEEELLKKNEELSASYEQISATGEELRANLDELTSQEQALRESEEKFKTLFESAGDAIIIMDHNVFLDCNRRTLEIYRCTRDQIIGHSPVEFSPEHQPDGRFSEEKIKVKIAAAYQGENRFFEWVHVHHDGTPFIVEVSLNRFMVQGTYYLQAIIRDITGRKLAEKQVARLSELKEKLLGMSSLPEQLQLVSDSCIQIFGADFARVWLIKDADLCETGCRHATVKNGPEVCRNRSQCLHLVASSGRYTHIDGSHQRVPFGCYKIGRVASGEEPFFITNDVANDPRVHDHAWAQSLGLVSFAGFRLLSQDNKTVGVLALFRDRAILPDEEKHLIDLANTLSQVLISGIANETLRIKNEELHASYEQIAATEEELRANLDEMTRQETALRDSEELYRQFFKTTLDSVFITTPGGQWVDFNDALVEVFGYANREEVFGVPVSSFYAHPEERSEFLRLVERDGFVKERPLQFRKKDGAVVNGLITIVPQKHPDGSLKGFIGTVHDITGKKRVFAPQSTLEPFNRARAENLPDYIVLYGPDGKILYINPAALGAFGQDAETMTGTSVLSYVAEEFREIVAAKMAERQEMGEIPIYEIDLLAQDGLRKSVIVKGTQVLYQDNPATLLLIIDISLRKALEDQLTERAAELSRISAAFQQANKKQNLLSTITRHDINNQMMVLKGYLGVLESDLSDPTLTGYCRKAMEAAVRITAMIRFTKEYEEIGISEPAWQDCRTLVDTASKEAPLGKVRVSNDLPAGVEVFADPLIARVFYNLMDNAVRYGEKISTIRFSMQEAGSRHVIICEDDGDGVPLDGKERIFERGYGKNTGLGLALSREVLDITGITIRETGEPGGGARFEMMVPEDACRFTSRP